jgi:hypothetical protein
MAEYDWRYSQMDNLILFNKPDDGGYILGGWSKSTFPEIKQKIV